MRRVDRAEWERMTVTQWPLLSARMEVWCGPHGLLARAGPGGPLVFVGAEGRGGRTVLMPVTRSAEARWTEVPGAESREVARAQILAERTLSALRGRTRSRDADAAASMERLTALSKRACLE